MGIIEETIFSVYKDAIGRGDMVQAEHTVELVKRLREKIDIHGFIDPLASETEPVRISGTFFEPYPYRYYQEDGIVVMSSSAILLTKSENHLFRLLSDNETQGTDIKPITHGMIQKHLWDEREITSNALRLAVKRLRSKIESNPSKPKIFINFYNRGYLFLGRRTEE